jgi:hypothetical protein
LTFSPRQKPAHWCAAYFAILLVALAAVIGVDYAVDFYGVFHDSRSRAIRVYSNEPAVKYLLSYRYIPENFAGIVIGPSVSENLDISRVGSLRIYNASISGANISEEKLLADNILPRGHVRVAIFCIHPYLTRDHGPKSGSMGPAAYWSALGSIQLLRDYAHAAVAGLKDVPPLADENGVGNFGAQVDSDEAKVRWTHKLRDLGSVTITIDEQAFNEYSALLESVRKRGAIIVGFIPPIYGPEYAPNREIYERYFARIRALFRPEETVVDFNDPKYDAVTGDAAAFYDGTHLSDKGTRFFSAELRRLVAAQLTAGSGRAATTAPRMTSAQPPTSGMPQLAWGRPRDARSMNSEAMN